MKFSLYSFYYFTHLEIWSSHTEKKHDFGGVAFILVQDIHVYNYDGFPSHQLGRWGKTGCRDFRGGCSGLPEEWLDEQPAKEGKRKAPLHLQSSEATMEVQLQLDSGDEDELPSPSDPQACRVERRQAEQRSASLLVRRQPRLFLWAAQVSTYLIRWVELKFSCHVHALPLWAWFSWLCIVLGLTMSLDHGLACGFWTLPWALDWTWTVNFEDFSFALGVLLDFLGLCMWVRVRSWGFTLGAWIFNKVLKNLFYVCGLKQENIREILPLFALNLYLWPQQLCVSVSLIVKIIEI